ncbi:MAG: methyltransferase [Paludisphaera borealis]|uniref:methyltransferase n=1 Tax=Paludisphaera borealis TaxID=1387353 RepID=UPI00284CABB9|nr:methyltransferase [Paludisphaera borealis]MDR3620148.1 methyltransferase [Paludisphaera borealis]
MPEPAPLASLLALQNLILGKWVSQAVSVAAKLGIADLLKDGPRHCDELARAAEVDATALYRLLRALASVGVFTEEVDRRFALTPTAELLRSDVRGSLRAVATMTGEEWTWRPWGELHRSVKTGERAFDGIFGMPPFAYLAANPGAASIFDEAMTGWSVQNSLAVAAAYDFSGIGALMDVGGGHGYLLATILKANPALRGVLYETAEVSEGAKARFAAEGLADRCQVASGDFFAAVPAGADACILKSVIHDWDDSHATTILRNCRQAVGPGGRVLLAEMVVPPGNDPHVAKLLDLEMLIMVGGHERTEAQFRDLLAGAGLRLTRIVPTASPTCVIEAVVD